MSKPKEKKNTEFVIKKKVLDKGEKIPPFDASENDKIGQVDAKERV